MFIGDSVFRLSNSPDKQVNAEETTDRIKGKTARLDFDSGPSFRLKLGLGFFLVFFWRALCLRALVCGTRAKADEWIWSRDAHSQSACAPL